MDILKDKVKPIYFKYLLAASGSAMVVSVFGMIDAMMVGQYHGPTGTAALAVFSPLWSIIYCLGLLSGIGGSVLFANLRGRGEEGEAQQYFTLAVIYGVFLSAVAMIGIGVFQDPLLRFFGADDQLLGLAKLYLKPVIWAFPCCVFTSIFSAYLRNDNNPGLATKAVIIGGIFNCAADYFCVFILDLGILGAGIATSVAQYVAMFAMMAHFVSKKNTLRLVKPVAALKKIGDITLTGFSTAISDLALGIIGILFNRQVMKYLGADALAVYGIIIQVTVLAQCIAYGPGQAAQPIISQNYGAGQYDRIRECTKYSLQSAVGMGLFWMAVMLLFPNALMNFFMDATPAVAEIAPRILRIYGLSYLILPFNIFVTYYFQAMMKPDLALTASIARGVVVSGVAIMLLPVILGPDSIWYAMLITELIMAIFGIYYIVRCNRQLK